MSQSGISIIEYKPEFEKGWLHCRILSFLDSAYYDDIYQNKEIYENPSIELLAVVDDQVIGILDIEYETTPQSICSRYSDLPSDHLAGMIWHLAVHPEHRRKGVATSLLKKALEICKSKKLSRLEAWTRDDQFVLDWYLNNTAANGACLALHIVRDHKPLNFFVVLSKDHSRYCTKTGNIL